MSHSQHANSIDNVPVEFRWPRAGTGRWRRCWRDRNICQLIHRILGRDYVKACSTIHRLVQTQTSKLLFLCFDLRATDFKSVSWICGTVMFSCRSFNLSEANLKIENSWKQWPKPQPVGAFRNWSLIFLWRDVTAPHTLCPIGLPNIQIWL